MLLHDANSGFDNSNQRSQGTSWTLIEKQKLKSKIQDVALTRIVRCRHVSLFCKQLNDFMIFHKKLSGFNFSVQENIHKWKGWRNHFVLNKKLLNGRIIAQCFVGRMPMDVHSHLNKNITLEHIVFISKL